LPGAGLQGLDHAGALVGHGFDHGLVAEAEQALHFIGWRGGGHVAVVELGNKGNGWDIEAIFFDGRGRGCGQGWQWIRGVLPAAAAG